MGVYQFYQVLTRNLLNIGFYLQVHTWTRRDMMSRGERTWGLGGNRTGHVLDMMRHDMMRHDMMRHDMMRHDQIWHDQTRHDETGDMTRRDTMSHETWWAMRHDENEETWHDMTRHDEPWWEIIRSGDVMAFGNSSLPFILLYEGVSKLQIMCSSPVLVWQHIVWGVCDFLGAFNLFCGKR